MYTSMYIFPADQQFKVTTDFLEKLVHYLACDRVQILSGTDRPDFWDSDYDEPVLISSHVGIYRTTSDPGDVLRSDVSFNEAFTFWARGQFCVVWMELSFGDTAKRIAREVEELIPYAIRGGHVSWDTSVTLGPWSESDWEQTKTVASGSFCISFSGDDTPSDPTRYIQMFVQLPGVQEFLAWLKEQTNVTWNLEMSLS